MTSSGDPRGIESDAAETLENETYGEGESEDGQSGGTIVERTKFVVAIGASAGGLASLEAFFENVPSQADIAYILIQHLSPTYKSVMGEILARHTSLPISTVTDNLEILSDHVYIIPEDHNIEVSNGSFRLTDRNSTRKPNHPIDVFFHSLASEYGTRAIAVILSGTGTDGTEGIHAIKQAGGAVLVQDDSAQFDGMPKSAIASGLADLILAPEDMPRQIVSYAAIPSDQLSLRQTDPTSATLAEMILVEAKRRTGIDFTQYKLATVFRRIEKRMRLNQVATLEDYHRLVESSEREANSLIRDLMIGVTSFFRDERAFEILRDQVIPRIIESTKENEVIRVWVGGCASGEEAYSHAIALHELIESGAAKREFKVFATDLNHASLQKASAGRFDLSITHQLPSDLLRKYFIREGDGFRIARHIRDRMVFARHNIAKDAPFTRMDIVSCRNVLIYQKDELQDHVLGMLSFALRPGGYLFLGSSETLARHRDEFEVIDARWRIFRKKVLSQAPKSLSVPHLSMSQPRAQAGSAEQKILAMAAPALLEERGEAAIITDSRQNVIQSLGRVSAFLQVPEGAPTRNLTKMLRGRLRISVPNLVRRILRTDENNPRVERLHLRDQDSENHTVSITVRRIESRINDEPILVVILAEVETEEVLLNGTGQSIEADYSEAHISALEQELSETREHLQSTIEEIESANEELQSANEELVASNEEMQSTNEELHSVNEELHTVNAEYQRKLDEQRLLSTDMENLLDIGDIGTVFLDRQLRIRKFTPAVARVVPLLAQDIGRPIEHIRHGLLDCDLMELVRRVFAAEKGSELEVANGDGRWLLVRAVPYRDSEERCSGVVVNFVDISAMREARESLAESEERFRQIAEHIGEVFWVRSSGDGALEYVSPAWETIWDRQRSELHGGVKDWCAWVHDDEHVAVMDAYELMVRTGDMNLEYRIIRKDGGVRWLRDRGFPIRDSDGKMIRIAGICEDITPQKTTEVALRTAAATMDELASRDALTGLQNRRGLEKVLSAETARSQRFGGRLMAILIDCDDFKSVNDTLGHAAGDVVLREVCTRMQRVMRPNDVLARIGGDEFLALLPDTRNREAFHVAERLRLAITETGLHVGNRMLKVTASLGVGAVPADTISPEEIIQEIQGALAQSKRAGKNCVAGVGESTLYRDDGILEDLRSGRGLRVYSQSIRNIKTGAIIGCELLSRGPAGSLESPDDFFRFSVENDMLTAVDLKCLKNCLGAIHRLPDPLPKQVHVNLYPSSLLDLDLNQLKIWAEPLLEITQLCVELSEQQFIGDPNHLRERVMALKSWGLHIAIDDVGFGRSSLESLIVLQPDVIKIDRIYVHGVAKDSHRRQNLERLLGVSRSLSAEVVAEGIEDRADLDVLLEFGVSSGQGYLWDRPQPISA